VRLGARPGGLCARPREHVRTLLFEIEIEIEIEIEAGRWAAELCDLFGVPPHAPPDVVPASQADLATGMQAASVSLPACRVWRQVKP
jgi:hypothetical protein